MSTITLCIGNAVLRSDKKRRSIELESIETSLTDQLGFMIFKNKTNEIEVPEYAFGEALTYESEDGQRLERYLYNGCWEESEISLDVVIDKDFLAIVDTVLDTLNDHYPDIIANNTPDHNLTAHYQRLAQAKALLAWIYGVGTQALSLTAPTLSIIFDN